MKKNEVKKNNKGFSLVELIVVIAIMAVLVGVLAPQFIRYVEKSRESTDIQNIQQIMTAVETYYADDETGSVTFKLDLTTTSTATTGKDALTSSGITSVGLKSTKWGGVKLAYDGTNWTVGQGTAYDDSKKKDPYYDLATQLGATKGTYSSMNK